MRQCYIDEDSGRGGGREQYDNKYIGGTCVRINTGRSEGSGEGDEEERSKINWGSGDDDRRTDYVRTIQRSAAATAAGYNNSVESVHFPPATSHAPQPQPRLIVLCAPSYLYVCYTGRSTYILVDSESNVFFFF